MVVGSTPLPAGFAVVVVVAMVVVVAAALLLLLFSGPLQNLRPDSLPSLAMAKRRALSMPATFSLVPPVVMPSHLTLGPE